MKLVGIAVSVMFLVCALSRVAGSQVVFSADFEGGLLPSEFTAPNSVIEPVQGYAGLGTTGNQFAGSFLRYTAQDLVDTKLTLTNLPAHDHVSVGFLLAVIDSWDGTELFQISIDGSLVFSNWFQLATGDASSYLAPVGGLLSSGTNLGFSNGSWYGRDRAYDLSVDPAFVMIPHTASSIEIVWHMSAVSGGAAQQWQGGGDESWAIENVKVELFGAPTPVGNPPSITALTLLPNHPNPFTAATELEIGLPGSSDVGLEVFDVAGRRVRQETLTGRSAGRQTVAFDGRDDGGRALASGVYFYRVTANGNTVTRKMVIAR